MLYSSVYNAILCNLASISLYFPIFLPLYFPIILLFVSLFSVLFSSIYNLYALLGRKATITHSLLFKSTSLSFKNLSLSLLS